MRIELRTVERYLLPILLVCSLGVNIMLAGRTKVLERTILMLKAEHQLAPGQRLPVLAGITMSGERISIAFDGAPRGTILYVFSPTCLWCARNLPNTLAAAEGARGRYNFVGVSLGPDMTTLAKYLMSNGIKFEIIHSVPSQLAAAYGLGVTPETILVSPEGVVQRVWRGAWGAGTQAEIEALLQTMLPGLLPPSGQPRS